MNSILFHQSLAAEILPPGLSPYQASLWYDAKGNWDEAHRIIQDIEDAGAARIHAYLHRKEGDLSNAAYWYRLAGKKPATASLQEEWNALAEEFSTTENTPS